MWILLANFFQNSHDFYLKHLTCQVAINSDKKNSNPSKLILDVEFFNIWGIDFMGSIPNFEYILMVVDYVS